MSMESALKNNILIAEFMQIKKQENYFIHGCVLDVNSELFSVNNFKYHSSWDWIMPVVEKIESLGYWFENRGTYCAVGKHNDEAYIISLSFSSMRTSKVEAVYKTVVKFIEWYNKQSGESL